MTVFLDDKIKIIMLAISLFQVQGFHPIKCPETKIKILQDIETFKIEFRRGI